MPELRVDKPGLDIVVPVFLDEIALLRLQARSLEKFLPPDWQGRILIVSNDIRLQQLKRLIRSIVMPEFRRLRPNVSILEHYRLIGTLDPLNGWIAQQAVKILASKIVDTEFYLVLDAKNQLIRPVQRDDFFTASGKAKHTITNGRMGAYLEAHQLACSKIFGVDPGKAEFCFEAVTPFLLHTSTVREMVAEIEQKFGYSFDRFFCGTRNLSEFLLYEAFLHTRPQEAERLYEARPRNTACFWPPSAGRSEQTEWALQQARTNEHIIATACHREFLKAASSDQLKSLEAYWREIGLLSATESFQLTPVHAHVCRMTQ